jgi:hypothetical protein
MLKKLKTFLGHLLYWSAAGIAVIVLALGIVLAAGGNPLAAIFLGLTGLAIWFVGRLIRNAIVPPSLVRWR